MLRGSIYTLGLPISISWNLYYMHNVDSSFGLHCLYHKALPWVPWRHTSLLGLPATTCLPGFLLQKTCLSVDCSHMKEATFAGEAGRAVALRLRQQHS